MKDQVASLFSLQYGVSKQAFSTLIDNFYDHPFQKGKCIRIAALDGKTVVGFQSFFSWPYEMNGKTYRSFQSGNSLVHPSYRSKGIFRKLLEYIDLHREEMGIDFLLGFPIEVSKNSFLRNGWKNILNLDWFVCPSSILSIFSGNENEKLKTIFSQNNSTFIPSSIQNLIHLSTAKEFVDWRINYSTKLNHFYHTYTEKDKTICFSLKTSRRKRIIRELIIGNISTNSKDSVFIQKSLKDLITIVKARRCISIISFAQNPNAFFISSEIIQNVGFKKNNRQIYFCVKSFGGSEPIEDASKWQLFRSDIDTW